VTPDCGLLLLHREGWEGVIQRQHRFRLQSTLTSHLSTSLLVFSGILLHLSYLTKVVTFTFTSRPASQSVFIKTSPCANLKPLPITNSPGYLFTSHVQFLHDADTHHACLFPLHGSLRHCLPHGVSKRVAMAGQHRHLHPRQ
jgi:hypothetical protein